ncbi:MAG: hypothetical protein HYZ28_18675 [Myxococcales bacterium]|nr:hypothetical protein [Myxococcales bacterium]
MTEVNRRCREFRRAFLLAGEGTHAGSHPGACAECRAFVDAERSVGGLLRSHAPRWRASDQLRRRVEAVLHRHRSRRLLQRRALLAASIALVAGGGLGWWWLRADGTARARAACDLMAEDFLKYAPRGAEKLQVSSASAAVVEAFFAEELRLGARVPRLSEAVVLGGRRCNLGGRPAALIFLEREGPAGHQPLSLFAFEPRGEDWTSAASAPGPRPRRFLSSRGVGILVWEERGLTYALAGALDAAELASVLDGPR